MLIILTLKRNTVHKDKNKKDFQSTSFFSIINMYLHITTFVLISMIINATQVIIMPTSSQLRNQFKLNSEEKTYIERK